MNNSGNSNNNLFKKFLEEVDVNSCISYFNRNNENKIIISISSVLEIINDESIMLNFSKHCLLRNHFKNFSKVFFNGFIPVTLDDLTLTALKNFHIFYTNKINEIKNINEKEYFSYHTLVNDNKLILFLFNSLISKDNSVKKETKLINLNKIIEEINLFKDKIHDLSYLFKELMKINIEMNEVKFKDMEKSFFQIKNNFEKIYNNLLSINVIPFLKQTLLFYIINDNVDYISKFPMKNEIKAKNKNELTIISKRFYNKKSYIKFQKLVITKGIEEVLKRIDDQKKMNEILKFGGSNEKIDFIKINKIVRKEVALKLIKKNINYRELYNNKSMEQLKLIITKRIKKIDDTDNAADVDNGIDINVDAPNFYLYFSSMYWIDREKNNNNDNNDNNKNY
ncbi:hypothetical protein PIROE2DRAFT_8974 [Piromyces sp. E2]|nr:hypothetical protein PIROE2DRAFT_8974 [Piromyces sp. E2]|eukprot:OUM64292.1 hypothetical protein PIROE2DRAFT_8974 [Piromyces sp. E2]